MPLSDRTLKRIFEDEPGVIAITTGAGAGKNRKSLIPEAVVKRVLTRNAQPQRGGALAKIASHRPPAGVGVPAPTACSVSR
jgi:hypothetical protein